MNRRIWAQLRLAALLLVFGASVLLGLKEGFDGYRSASSMSQRIAATTQLLYGAAALGCIAALFIRPPWAKAALFTWMLALIVTGALAPVVWGSAGWIAGLEGGLLVLVVGALVVWGSLVHIRSV